MYKANTVLHSTSIHRTHIQKAALCWACQFVRCKAADFIIDRGADVAYTGPVDRPVSSHNTGYMPLHHAAQEGRRQMVQLLRERGAPFNFRSSEHHETALLGAVDQSWPPEEMFSVVGFLFEAGADCTLPADYGKIALHAAAEHGFGNALNTILRGF